MFKTPNAPDMIRVVLIVVVLVTIIEVLVPGVSSIILGRTPVVAGSETPIPLYKGVFISEELSPFILFYCLSDSPFIVFKQKPSSLSTTVAAEIQAITINWHCANQ